jgi:phosphatidate cytidylyltransferase
VATSLAAVVEPARDAGVASLLRRAATAVVVIPIFVWVVTKAPAWMFPALVSAAALVALWEFYRLFAHAGQPCNDRLGIMLGLALVVSFEIAGGDAIVPVLPALVLSVAIGVITSAPIFTGGKPATEGVALTLLGVLYVSWFLGHALLLRHLADGAALVLVLVGITWAGETAAYAVGSLVGRHKLVTAISPRKTVEGAVAQLVASIVASVLLGPAWLLPTWTVSFAVGAGAILGVVGQLGDLAESAIKRSVGVKDAGGLIPGHGGVLDRIDGLLFNVPALYYYVRLGTGS